MNVFLKDLIKIDIYALILLPSSSWEMWECVGSWMTLKKFEYVAKNWPDTKINEGMPTTKESTIAIRIIKQRPQGSLSK